PLWPELGLGFLQVGPAAKEPVPAKYATNPQLLKYVNGVVASQSAGASAASAIATSVTKTKSLVEAPVGIALKGDDLLGALNDVKEQVDFISLPGGCAADPILLESLRTATYKPLLLRFAADLPDAELDLLVTNAVQHRIDGCIVTDGVSADLIEDGRLYGPNLRDDAVRLVRRISEKYGDAFPVIGSGGIMTPEDAIAVLAAGARLVEVYEGFIFAGPGFPKRIVQQYVKQIRHGSEKLIPPETEIETPNPPVTVRNTFQIRNKPLGWLLLAIVGLTLMFSGLFAIGVSATTIILPHELNFLGMTIADLEALYERRLLLFMAHDRIIFGGALIELGIMFLWLVAVPLRQGKGWAWWTLLFSGTVGAASFLNFLVSDYLDVWHAVATVTLTIFFALGLFFSYSKLEVNRAFRDFLIPSAKAWTWSPGGLGRVYMLFWAASTTMGGFLILATGMSSVFVPTDLAYIGTTADLIQEINIRLTPYIAHDRLGFAGALFAAGIAGFFIIWHGIKPRARSTFITIVLAYLVGMLTAIGAHPPIGYTTFEHLFPFIAKDIAFFLGMIYLYRPIFHVDTPTNRFPDLNGLPVMTEYDQTVPSPQSLLKIARRRISQAKLHPVYSQEATVYLESRETKFDALDQAVDASGFLDNVEAVFAASGKAREAFLIALKPNIMTASSWEEDSPVYTDPALVGRLFERLRERGFENFAVVEARNVYDYSYAGRSVRAVAEMIGYDESLGYHIEDLSEQKVPYRYGGVLGHHSVGRTWMEADYRISFAKNKTHWQCFYTGCLKNIYGCLPEWDKMKHYHGRGREFFECCILILDAFPVNFGFLDAWVSGDGFSGHVRDASPNPTHTIFASPNVLALDWVMGEKMGINPATNYVIQEALIHWEKPIVHREGDMSPWSPWVNVKQMTVSLLDSAEEAYSFSRFMSRAFANAQDKRFPPVSKGQWLFGPLQRASKVFERLFIQEN
ncbi:MAG: DUF362 domain-containing protein, partial [Candidatus Promineifilaceae bacterium]